MSLGATVVLQVLLLAAPGETYAEAHKTTTEKGYPLVVMVGATWCPACQQMKQNVIPEVKRHGVFQKVAFAEVDLDRERELGTELTEGGPIPQIVVYRKTSLGWRLRRLIGGHDARTVERFIGQDVEEDKGAQSEPATARSPAGRQAPKASPAGPQTAARPTPATSK